MFYLICLIILISLCLLKLGLKVYSSDNSRDDPFLNYSFEKKKKLIQDNFKQLEGKIKLKKNTSHLYRSRNDNDQKLNLNFLQKVIQVNHQENWVHVEGLMTYRDLVKYLLPMGKIPLIVPEFSSLTVGGVISGVGIESSSFRYGLTYDTAIEYTVLCGDGSIKVASSTENQELFKALPNSYGTFGYILSAKIKLRDVKPYLRLGSLKYSSIKDYITAIKKYSQDQEVDFIDGLIISPREMYLLVGQMSHEYDTELREFSQEIYYQTVMSEKVIYMTIEDYFWRYDYNCFYLGGPFENRLIRRFLGSELRSDKIKKIGQLFQSCFPSRESIVNDLGITLEDLPSFLDWYDQKVGVYPVWICPYQTFRDTYFFEDKSPLAVDFGIGFGVDSPRHPSDPNYYKKLIDQKMFEMKSKKGLYSNTFLSKEDFWSLYGPEETYRKLKRKYDPENRFYDLYQKTVGLV